ncbi:hypothetical protein F2P81_006716 [Scophthalmus maximus]|uniref:Fanconi anemia group A protein n=1 Tax=Scophthalmus maximus TaxID=52904 RepID=A0A6A4T8W8_SCOMX|nr:hypothetical protein F2P81_006716 [Scophthalmus maximus]
MSVSASCESVCRERSVSSLLAGRVVKRLKQDEGQRLQEAAIQLLEQQQNLSALLREVGNLDACNQSGELRTPAAPEGISSAVAGSLLACELRRQAARLGVPVATLSVKTTLERLTEITRPEGDEDERRELLTSPQRRSPELEVVYHLHRFSILSLQYILERIQIFDASLCGVSASADALQSFFTHSLTQVLTYKPRLTVSDAVALQNEWTFAKASCLLTSLFRKLAVVFSVELLLRRLQQVLETHEVNWKHVLCFLSTLLVYNPCAAPSLRELLSRLLTSAFEGYDLEHMITAFLLARQGALEGAAVFSSYSDWFKMSFGGSSGFHAASKKSLVFLLKFLSDLVPFEPPQYLKFHILHPPFVPVKHRGLLMEYVSLAKTRLTDLRFHILHPPFVPVKHRGLLMEYVSLAKTRLTDLRESVEDMGLYEDVSGAGGAPTQLPVKPDARMNLIEALRKADKIPAPQFSSYVESCQKHRRQDLGVVCVDTADGPLDVLTVQLQEFRTLVVDGNDGETMSQLSRISHTLSVVFPGRPDEFIQQTVVRVHLGAPLSPELHVKFHKLSSWKGSSLTSAHVLGLAAFVVHLHASSSQGPLVQLDRPIVPPRPVPVGEALSAALTCSTRTNMIFCIRFFVAAVCYGMCRGDSLPQQQDYVLSSFYKKLLFLVPRLLPEARRTRQVGDERQEEQNLWGGVTHSSCTWRTAARRLWTDAAFQQLQETTPQYQLSFSDWLLHELRVQRSDDTLTDPERSLEQLDERVSATGTCLPDIMSRLQEFVYEMEATSVCGRADVCEFLFEFVSRRCSGPTASSDTQSVGSELGLQHTLNTWNRVVLALPAPLFVQLKAEGGRTTLDCTRLMEHINQHQRKACSPAGSMSFHLTTHFLRVLVFLLFLCVNDHLSTLLYPQDDSDQRSMTLFSDLLSVLVDSADWLLIFKSSEQGVYQSVTLVTTDECTRLMPWAFYSLLLQQGAELLHRAVLCPGFLHAAVLCYVRLLQLFLDGRTSVSTAEQQQHQRQSEPSQILSRAKSFLLRAISQTPPATLSSGQLRRLESQCADLDPEVAAALSMHLAAPSLSPEMDFL